MTLAESEPLDAVAGDLRAGRRDPSAYVAHCCDRIDAVDDELRALLPEPGRRRRLRDRAATLASRYPTRRARPPLYGVPVGVKDVIHVDGFPTRAGSDLPPEELSGPEAAVVTALRKAGALVLGKTVTAEFAFDAPGPTRNPHDLERTPGGSSSGSAAAVAAGLCPLALGTQTGGSTLRPAAFCGVVGFKPTYDRIPTDGVVPLSPTLDHVGLFTQDVPGMRLAARVCCSGWTPTAPAERPVLGVPSGPYLDNVSAVGSASFERTTERLAEAGFRLRRVDVLEDAAAWSERQTRLMAAEAALAHHEWFEAYADRYAPSTADLVRRGRGCSVGDLAARRAGARRLRQRLDGAMADHDIDLWVTPATPGPAPAGIENTGDSVMNRPWTHAGLPAVSLPAGRTDAGLPLGLQCVGRFGDDERLLAWSEEVARPVDPG